MENNDDTLQYVYDRIEQEGFWYCFDSYSDFREVKDEKFHQLRKQLVASGNELKDYVEQNK